MKTYTNLEQSKKLAEILPIESADMRYVPFGGTHPWIWNDNFLENGATPCWSLAALLNVLPCPSLDNTFGEWRCQCYKEDHHVATAYADDPVGACYEMTLKLHEQKIL